MRSFEVVRVLLRREFTSPAGQCTGETQCQQAHRRWFGHIGQADTVVAKPMCRLRGGQHGGLVEIVRERREVFAVHRSIVIEVAIIPTAVLANIGREWREVFAVHLSVEVGIAQQREHDFDLARWQARDHAVGAVGVTDAITETAGDVVGCYVAADDAGPLPTDSPLEKPFAIHAAMEVIGSCPVL